MALLELLFDVTLGFFPTVVALSAMAGVARGQPRTMGFVLADAWGNFGRVLWAQLRAWFGVLLYSVVFVIPALIPLADYWLAGPAAYLEREGDPLSTSRGLTAGRRVIILALAGLGMVVTVAPIVLGRWFARPALAPSTAESFVWLGGAFLRHLGGSFRAGLALAAFYGLQAAATSSSRVGTSSS